MSDKASLPDIPLEETASKILTNSAPPYSFTFTPFLLATHHHGLSPNRAICTAYASGTCPSGTKCLHRHVSTPSSRPSGPTGGLNSLVCKHWLRGLCKKGEGCEFLHEFNLRKMPECNFFSRNGFCSNGEECLYLHIDPAKRMVPCPHYERGFCPLGPNCAKRHLRRRVCEFYLVGFCPDGRQCERGVHPRWTGILERPMRMEEKRVLDEEAAAIRRAEMEREVAAGGERYTGGYDRGEDGGRGGFHHRGRGRGRGTWRGRGGGGYRGRGTH